MSQTSKLISDLQTKVDMLIEKKKETKTSEENKIAEIESLYNKLSEKEQMISKLNSDLKEAEEKASDKIEIVEESVNEEANSEHLKLRINELVGEIDKCISLLKA